MSNDRIAGQWKQLRRKLKQQWGQLTDDDLTIARGDTLYLVGKLQRRYGISRDKAEARVRDFSHEL